MRQEKGRISFGTSRVDDPFPGYYFLTERIVEAEKPIATAQSSKTPG
jgi:hypothetical protein